METLLIVLLIIFLLFPILVANVLARRSRRGEMLVFDILLFLINLPVLLFGLIFLALPGTDFQEIFETSGFNLADVNQIGLILILMAAWGMAAAIGPVRRLLARLVPINPESPVHTLALVLSGYLAGQSVLTLSQEGLVGLAENTQSVSIDLVILSELLLAIVALFGVGFLIRRDWRGLIGRLGLAMPTAKQLLVAAGIIVALVIVQGIAGAMVTYLYPEQAELLETISSSMLGEMDTAWEWMLLALAAGIGEELLFRGALQPAFGIAASSLLFALLHVQYGYTPFILVVVVIAVVLGLIRRYASTTIAIIVHVGYDFALGLIALLATYLQQFAG